MSILNCSRPFAPTEFFSNNSNVWRGPIDGNGLSGEPDIDPRADSLTKVDFGKVLFEHCVKKGEHSITGEEKLRRLKKRELKLIRLGGPHLLALLEDWQKRREQSVLEYLRKKRRITGMDFPGLVLRDSNGNRFIPYLEWDDGQWGESESDEGEWYCLYSWLFDDPCDRRLSVCSPAS